MVVYSSPDEVIVCEASAEKQMLIDYFDEGGRNLFDFDREETGTFTVVSNLRIK